MSLNTNDTMAPANSWSAGNRARHIDMSLSMERHYATIDRRQKRWH